MILHKRLDIILNGGINRKQYIILLIIGFILAPIKLLAALYIGMFFSEVVGYRAYGIVIGIFAFVLIGIYFYIIKMKRLRDIGLGDDAFLISHNVPGGSTVLEALLLGKKSQKSTKHHVVKLTTKSFFQSKSEIFLVVSLFILLFALYLVLYMTLLNVVQ